MTDGDATILRAGRLTAVIDRRGAVIAEFHWRGADGEDVPLMRCNADYVGDPLTAGCFPLLPFCNRVRDNRFSFEGRNYGFEPNQPWDRHYLHGDGWLTDWDVSHRTPTSVLFAMQRTGDAMSPYAYAATVEAAITAVSLGITLTVENRSDRALPFGLGLHPYFPLTVETTLHAPAASFFAELAEFMPGERLPMPDDLRFDIRRTLPRRWVNNGFSGWGSQAEIAWPERSVALRIGAEAAFRDYFVFMSDTRFEPGFMGDYFCFEPMTHQANGHHAADLGGLVVLAPEQVLSSSVSFSPYELPMSDRSVP
jgi:aldose 1-epimerase